MYIHDKDDSHIPLDPGDKLIKCVNCGVTFIFTEGEQRFYNEKELTPPKRCKPCREARRAERQQDQSSGV